MVLNFYAALNFSCSTERLNIYIYTLNKFVSHFKINKMKYFITFAAFFICIYTNAQPTQKPPLHGKNWMAITGKPLAATAGSLIFQRGGNAVDAACAMLAATCTMWDVLSWGGETQALIYNPKTKKVIGINALQNLD